MKPAGSIDNRKFGKRIAEEKFSFLRKVFLTEYADFLKENKDASAFFEYVEANETSQRAPHYYRYLATMMKILKCHGMPRGLRIIETGDASPLLLFLAAENECFTSESDLRIKLDAEDASADIILSFEVLEHIKDMPEKRFDEVVLFQESGARQYASEMHRSLKPGGSLFLTTPNVCAASILIPYLKGEPPVVFRPHVREYSRTEITGLFGDYDVAHYESFNSFFLIGAPANKHVDAIAQMGGDTADRGDDHFFHFKKALA
jgi:SAM-dependent methyltransferase